MREHVALRFEGSSQYVATDDLKLAVNAAMTLKRRLVPPLAGALLKNEQDLPLFERLVFMNRNNR